MRIAADTEVCASSGMCALTVPEVFDQDGVDGRVVLRMVEPPAAEHDRVRQAVRLCPSQALRVIDG